MFESYLLIPDSGFCGNRLKNKNKTKNILRCLKKSNTGGILHHFAWAQDVLGVESVRGFRSISRFLKDLSDGSRLFFVYRLIPSGIPYSAELATGLPSCEKET